MGRRGWSSSWTRRVAIRTVGLTDPTEPDPDEVVGPDVLGVPDGDMGAATFVEDEIEFGVETPRTRLHHYSLYDSCIG